MTITQTTHHTYDTPVLTALRDFCGAAHAIGSGMTPLALRRLLDEVGARSPRVVAALAGAAWVDAWRENGGASARTPSPLEIECAASVQSVTLRYGGGRSWVSVTWDRNQYDPGCCRIVRTFGVHDDVDVRDLRRVDTEWGERAWAIVPRPVPVDLADPESDLRYRDETVTVSFEAVPAGEIR